MSKDGEKRVEGLGGVWEDGEERVGENGEERARKEWDIHTNR